MHAGSSSHGRVCVCLLLQAGSEAGATAPVMGSPSVATASLPQTAGAAAAGALDLSNGGGKILKSSSALGNGLQRLGVSPYPSPAEMLALKQHSLLQLSSNGGQAAAAAALQVRSTV